MTLLSQESVLKKLKEEIASFGYQGHRIGEVAASLQSIMGSEAERVDDQMLESIWEELRSDRTIRVVDGACMKDVEAAVDHQSLLRVKVMDIVRGHYKFVKGARFVSFRELLAELGGDARLLASEERQHAMMMYNSSKDANELSARAYNVLHAVMVAGYEGLTRSGLSRELHMASASIIPITDELAEAGLIMEKPNPNIKHNGVPRAVYSHPRYWFDGPLKNIKMDREETSPIPANANIQPVEPFTVVNSTLNPLSCESTPPARLSDTLDLARESMARHTRESSPAATDFANVQLLSPLVTVNSTVETMPHDSSPPEPDNDVLNLESLPSASPDAEQQPLELISLDMEHDNANLPDLYFGIFVKLPRH
ncbi:hypothetical protein BC940DRAFT_336190 [Gongronella butleri]|nr:hypothetical protein BC940DRAFT_336190 [Gongronella butleri]